MLYYKYIHCTVNVNMHKKWSGKQNHSSIDLFYCKISLKVSFIKILLKGNEHKGYFGYLTYFRYIFQAIQTSTIKCQPTLSGLKIPTSSLASDQQKFPRTSRNHIQLARWASERNNTFLVKFSASSMLQWWIMGTAMTDVT